MITFTYCANPAPEHTLVRSGGQAIDIGHQLTLTFENAADLRAWVEHVARLAEQQDKPS